MIAKFVSSYLFWVGVVLGPFLWLIICWVLWRLLKQRQAIADWYKGLPLIQWPAMMLIVLGCKIVRGKYCKFMTYDGRFWLSPNVKGFETGDND